MSRACCDEHSHDHPEGGDRLREIIELGVSGLLFGLSFAFGSASLFLLIPAYLIAGYRMLIAAGWSVAKLKPFDENVPYAGHCPSQRFSVSALYTHLFF